MTTYDSLIAGGVQFVRKEDSWTMRALGWLLGSWFMLDFVTTVRWPFCPPRIYYPTSILRPEDMPDWLLRHERHHIWQFRGPLGWLWMALLFATPCGRWRIERRAFLAELRTGRRGRTDAAVMFRRRYRFPFPASWMPSVDSMVEWWDEHWADPEQPW